MPRLSLPSMKKGSTLTLPRLSSIKGSWLNLWPRLKKGFSSIKEALPVELRITLSSGDDLALRLPPIKRILSASNQLRERVPSAKEISPANLKRKSVSAGEALRRLPGDLKRLSSTKIGMPAQVVVVLNSGREVPLRLPALGQILPTFFGVKRGEVINFSRNLATFLEAGVPIPLSLQILSQQGNGAFKKVLDQVLEDLEEGEAFSQACAKHPQAFSPFYIRLIEVGEETGNLAPVLRALAKQMEKDAAVASKIQGSMTYPAFILVLGAAVIGVMVMFVLPSMSQLYAGQEEAPLMMRIMLAGGSFLSQYITHLVLGVVLVGGLGWLLTSKTEKGRRWKDILLSKAPVIGNVKIKGSLSRLCRNMAILLSSGVSLVEGLRLMIQSSDSVLVKEALVKVNGHIHRGDLLSQAMSSQPIFPPMMTQMIEVGEVTGRLKPNLELVADFYEQEAEKATSALVGMMGPGLVLVIGLIVGIVAVSMFSSIYGVYEVFK